MVHRFDSGPGLGPLDLDLAAGARLAVVGSIGSGKTVLLQVLAGLREPQAGSLALDGAALDQDQLREHWAGIGWVPQDAFLFSASLRENLAMGRPDASEADLWETARVVCLDDLIRRLPRAWTRWWASGGSRSPAGNASAPPWPGRCCAGPGCCSWTTPCRRWTPRPRPGSWRTCGAS